MELLKVNVGCGGNKIPGWKNHDLEVDITKRLPYRDATVSFVLAEHVVEHVPPAGGWAFFKECRRILKPGGVLRIIVPSITRMVRLMQENHPDMPGYYAMLDRVRGNGTTPEKAIHYLVCDYGHQALWNKELLRAALETLGYQVAEVRPQVSAHPELNDVDGHGRSIGGPWNDLESEAVEATKV